MRVCLERWPEVVKSRRLHTERTYSRAAAGEVTSLLSGTQSRRPSLAPSSSSSSSLRSLCPARTPTASLLSHGLDARGRGRLSAAVPDPLWPSPSTILGNQRRLAPVVLLAAHPGRIVHGAGARWSCIATSSTPAPLSWRDAPYEAVAVFGVDHGERQHPREVQECKRAHCVRWSGTKRWCGRLSSTPVTEGGRSRLASEEEYCLFHNSEILTSEWVFM
ncbi:hypothetical protein C8Q79DRAFT_641718 [Trametes meyenii]|nr:hypothetical protein C8Q79DRAFT_641718 [Trametes meyenii]